MVDEAGERVGADAPRRHRVAHDLVRQIVAALAARVHFDLTGRMEHEVLEHVVVKRHVDAAPPQRPVGQHDRLADARVLNDDVVAARVHALYRHAAFARTLDRLLLYECCSCRKKIGC